MKTNWSDFSRITQINFFCKWEFEVSFLDFGSQFFKDFGIRKFKVKFITENKDIVVGGCSVPKHWNIACSMTTWTSKFLDQTDKNHNLVKKKRRGGESLGIIFAKCMPIPYQDSILPLQSFKNLWLFKYLKIPESKYFWKIGKTNKSTGKQIMNKFSYNSNAIWGKMRF